MRGRIFNLGKIGRVAGFVAVGAAMVATVVLLRHNPGRLAPSHDELAIAGDPLARELANCQALGAPAASDLACEAAWAENRRRFFSDDPKPQMLAPTLPRSGPPDRE